MIYFSRSFLIPFDIPGMIFVASKTVMKISAENIIFLTKVSSLSRCISFLVLMLAPEKSKDRKSPKSEANSLDITDHTDIDSAEEG